MLLSVVSVDCLFLWWLWYGLTFADATDVKMKHAYPVYISYMERRVCLATAKFNALHHVWRDGRLSRALRTTLYRVRIVPVLLYGCESWELCQTICKKIHGFHARCMKWIFNTEMSTRLSVKRLVGIYSRWHTGDAGCGSAIFWEHQEIDWPAEWFTPEPDHNHHIGRAPCRNCAHGYWLKQRWRQKTNEAGKESLMTFTMHDTFYRLHVTCHCMFQWICLVN